MYLILIKVVLIISLFLLICNFLFCFWLGIKFVILAPWVVHSTYSLIVMGEGERNFYFLIFPFLLMRMLHNQIWISISRYRNAKGKNRIVDKGLEFEQVDRESNWSVKLVSLDRSHMCMHMQYLITCA